MNFFETISKILFFLLFLQFGVFSFLSPDNEKKPKEKDQDLITLASINSNNKGMQLDPIIILPGLGGSRIEAKLENFDSNHWFCKENKDWFSTWLNIEVLVPEIIECFNEYFSFEYDPETRYSYDKKGASTRPITGSKGLENLDPTLSFIEAIAYFAKMLEKLRTFGYQEGKTLFPITYDWRLSPRNLTELFELVKYTIEYASEINSGSKVHLISHSMGCFISTLFFAQQTQEWKDRYIATWIPLSPPMGGVMDSLIGLFYGINFGIPIVTGSEVLSMERTFPSLYFFVPHSPYWTKPVVTTPTKEYYPTLQDIHQLLSDLDFPQSSHDMLDDNWDDGSVLTAPGVPTFFQIGSGLNTPIQIQYSDHLGGDYNIIQADGDGCTPSEVMTIACEEWPKQQTQTVECFIWGGAGHGDTVSDDVIIEEVIRILATHS
ncbi:group xv phospholipase a2 [Anaeramoeba ignava]|uniref:Group xv phospholipase a2 n=1 Tax=Anaeramoeba ignava TaxID=1746090 RepID=A0A9Q0LNX4_ANAIG|nr:group xv phospholipase a2 [Anaeramoeba ignava]